MEEEAEREGQRGDEIGGRSQRVRGVDKTWRCGEARGEEREREREGQRRKRDRREKPGKKRGRGGGTGEER